MTCPACGWGFHRDCEECQKRADELAARIRDYPEQPHKPMPQSNKERQEAYRARQALLNGAKEVRGIFLPEELHTELKKAAAAMRKKWEREQGKASPLA